MIKKVQLLNVLCMSICIACITIFRICKQHTPILSLFKSDTIKLFNNQYSPLILFFTGHNRVASEYAWITQTAIRNVIIIDSHAVSIQNECTLAESTQSSIRSNRVIVSGHSLGAMHALYITSKCHKLRVDALLLFALPSFGDSLPYSLPFRVHVVMVTGEYDCTQPPSLLPKCHGKRKCDIIRIPNATHAGWASWDRSYLKHVPKRASMMPQCTYKLTEEEQQRIGKLLINSLLFGNPLLQYNYTGGTRRARECECDTRLRNMQNKSTTSV